MYIHVHAMYIHVSICIAFSAEYRELAVTEFNLSQDTSVVDSCDESDVYGPEIKSTGISV